MEDLSTCLHNAINQQRPKLSQSMEEETMAGRLERDFPMVGGNRTPPPLLPHLCSGHFFCKVFLRPPLALLSKLQGFYVPFSPQLGKAAMSQSLWYCLALTSWTPHF